MYHRSTAGNKSVNRLIKEYKKLKEEPLELIDVCPDPLDMYKLHFVIHGAPDTPYFGGFYYGMLTFPVEYPLKPPSIMMFTPSGRFSTNTRLCLSMSDFHPETWNPMWSVSTILAGLLSFMNEDANAVGSIFDSENSRKVYAAKSLGFNVKDKKFSELFPDLVELYNTDEKIKLREKLANEGVLCVPETFDDAVLISFIKYGTIVLVIIISIIIYLLANINK